MLYDQSHARKRKQWGKGRHIVNGMAWVLCTPVLIGAVIVRIAMDVGTSLLETVHSKTTKPALDDKKEV